VARVAKRSGQWSSDHRGTAIPAIRRPAAPLTRVPLAAVPARRLPHLRRSLRPSSLRPRAARADRAARGTAGAPRKSPPGSADRRRPTAGGPTIRNRTGPAPPQADRDTASPSPTGAARVRTPQRPGGLHPRPSRPAEQPRLDPLSVPRPPRSAPRTTIAPTSPATDRRAYRRRPARLHRRGVPRDPLRRRNRRRDRPGARRPAHRVSPAVRGTQVRQTGVPVILGLALGPPRVPPAPAPPLGLGPRPTRDRTRNAGHDCSGGSVRACWSCCRSWSSARARSHGPRSRT
jgi:hypothetical protein